MTARFLLHSTKNALEGGGNRTFGWIETPALSRFFLSQTFKEPHACQCAYRQTLRPRYLLKFIHLSYFNAALYNGVFSKPFCGFPTDLFHTFAKALLPLFRCFFTGHH